MAKIWVVDDDSDIRNTTANVLQTAKHEVRIFENGEALLAAYKADKGEVDAVVSDYDMTGKGNDYNPRRMDGVALAQSLRAEGFASPFLLHSGTPLEIIRQEHPEYDAQRISAYVAKGGSAMDLIMQVKLALTPSGPDVATTPNSIYTPTSPALGPK